MKNLFRISPLIFILPILAGGCTFYRVNGNEIVYKSNMPQNNLEDIQYLETVNVPYEVIGTVNVSTERRNSITEVVDKMRRQIAVLGGDAVTNIIQTDEPSLFKTIRTKFTGTVIVFKNAADAPAGENQTRQNQEENLK